MSGFLSEYGGTFFLDVTKDPNVKRDGDGNVVGLADDPGNEHDTSEALAWWAEVRHNLEQRDSLDAARVLQGQITYEARADAPDEGRILQSGSDVGGYQVETVTRSVVSWNLTDRNGAVLPLGDLDAPPSQREAALATTRASVRRLPNTVFGRLLAAVDHHNRPPTPQEAATFPESNSSSGNGRRERPTDHAAVLGRAGALAEAGAEA